MVRDFLTWSLILQLLLFMCPPGIGAREIAEKRLEELMIDANVLRLPARNDPSGDPTFSVYFTRDDLKAGRQFSIQFPDTNPSTTSPHILPKTSLPFSDRQLSNLLKCFSVPQGSSEAKSMEATLRFCETKLDVRKPTFCATSTESMRDFLRSSLGYEYQPQSLATRQLSTEVSKSHFHNYTIQEAPKEIVAPKTVACHPLPYPYAVFYCHILETTESKLFKVSLAGENGDRVEAISICHDTAKTRWAWLHDRQDSALWATDDESLAKFEADKGSPNIVCHFFSADHLLWVPPQYA